MEYLTPILNLSITQLFAVGVLVIVLQRAGVDVIGILKSIFKLNGNNAKVSEKLDEIEGNHLHTIEAKIDELKQGQEKTNDLLLEAVLILRAKK